MDAALSTKLSRKQLFAVVKIAEVCNLKCPYCYFFFGGDQSFADDPPVIDTENVASIGKFLAKGAVELGLERVDISLHGGEPLMVGKKRFEAICTALAEELSGVCAFGINLQTNGALVDDEWAAIFRKHRIGVGVSVDGPQAVHDANRIDQRGRGTYRKTVAGIRALQKVAPIGALCVIPDGESGREIYRHFVDELGLKAMDFLLPIQNWDNFDAERTERVTRFYMEVLEEWLADNDPQVSVRTFSDPLAAMLSDRGAARRTSGLKDNCDSITVRSNGDICPDDTLTSINPAMRRTGHNVGSSSLRAFMAEDFWEQLRVTALEPAGDCVGCQWWGICRGGHADHRYSAAAGFRRKTTYCDTYKALYARLYDYVCAAIPKEQVDARLAAAATEL